MEKRLSGDKVPYRGAKPLAEGAKPLTGKPLSSANKTSAEENSRGEAAPPLGGAKPLAEKHLSSTNKTSAEKNSRGEAAPPLGGAKPLAEKHLSSTNKTSAEKNSRGEAAPPLGGADIHIVNTCAVTAEAVTQAQRHIRRYRKKHPEAFIVVTGCAAQVETQKFSHLPEASLVVANSHKQDIPSLIKKFYPSTTTQGAKPRAEGAKPLAEKHLPSAKNPDKENSRPEAAPPLGGGGMHHPMVFHSNVFQRQDLGAGGGVESQHSRLFLKIQDGCNSFCTFCVIPFARGKSRSLPLRDLVLSVQKHYDEGVREVVLTGVHIGDYHNPEKLSSSKKAGLTSLVKALLLHTPMPRIRLSSLEPVELTEELFELYDSPRMCPHFHLSVQSFHTRLLQKMKRTYTTKEVTHTLHRIHRQYPRAFVGMDIIAGFADESQKEFEDSYQRIKDSPWTRMHVFPYSPRPHTFAGKKFSTLPRSTITKRAALLRHLSECRHQDIKTQQTGTLKQVLPLKYPALSKTKGLWYGLSRDFWKVQWQSPTPPDFTREETLQIVSPLNPSPAPFTEYLCGKQAQRHHSLKPLHGFKTSPHHKEVPPYEQPP